MKDINSIILSYSETCDEEFFYSLEYIHTATKLELIK